MNAIEYINDLISNLKAGEKEAGKDHVMMLTASDVYKMLIEIKGMI